MTFWHRAIAIFLLMVFTPASLLAGTPARYCVGSDGHQGIEFVLTDSTHHEEPVATSGQDLGALLSDGSGCSDRPLFSASKQSPRLEPVKIKTALDDIPPLETLLAASEATPPAFHSIDFSDAITATDPRLVDRQTVVLLI